MLVSVGDDRFGLAHTDAVEAFRQGLGVSTVDVDLFSGKCRQGEGEGKYEAGKQSLEIHGVLLGFGWDRVLVSR